MFTSEAYGDELARSSAATHVCVDSPREINPVSGTALRADLVGNWHHLAPATKAGLARRVVVLGAESTGTTTLARDLAEALRARGGVWSETQWVPEYGRRHTELKLAALAAQRERLGLPAPTMADLVWTDGDFLDIAARQNSDEDAAAAIGSPILFCDTDAFATGVWYERYVGGRHPGVEALGDARQHDLYLLTDPAGVPFEQDGLRDGEHLRDWMHQRFIDRLTETSRGLAVMCGTPSKRVARAIRGTRSSSDLGLEGAEARPPTRRVDPPHRSRARSSFAPCRPRPEPQASRRRRRASGTARSRRHRSCPRVRQVS